MYLWRGLKDREPLEVEVEEVGNSMEGLQEKYAASCEGQATDQHRGRMESITGSSRWCLPSLGGNWCEIAEGGEDSGRIAAAKGGLCTQAEQRHRVAKGWRPISLINCIGKRAEKVVAFFFFFFFFWSQYSRAASRPWRGGRTVWRDETEIRVGCEEWGGLAVRTSK